LHLAPLTERIVPLVITLTVVFVGGIAATAGGVKDAFQQLRQAVQLAFFILYAVSAVLLVAVGLSMCVSIERFLQESSIQNNDRGRTSTLARVGNMVPWPRSSGRRPSSSATGSSASRRTSQDLQEHARLAPPPADRDGEQRRATADESQLTELLDGGGLTGVPGSWMSSRNRAAQLEPATGPLPGGADAGAALSPAGRQVGGEPLALAELSAGSDSEEPSRDGLGLGERADVPSRASPRTLRASGGLSSIDNVSDGLAEAVPTPSFGNGSWVQSKGGTARASRIAAPAATEQQQTSSLRNQLEDTVAVMWVMCVGLGVVLTSRCVWAGLICFGAFQSQDGVPTWAETLAPLYDAIFFFVVEFLPAGLVLWLQLTRGTRSGEHRADPAPDAQRAARGTGGAAAMSSTHPNYGTAVQLAAAPAAPAAAISDAASDCSRGSSSHRYHPAHSGAVQPLVTRGPGGAGAMSARDHRKGSMVPSELSDDGSFGTALEDTETEWQASDDDAV
jgi:hypothetical protein